MNKKILIFSHEFPPRSGGAGVAALDIATRLSHEGVEVTVITDKIGTFRPDYPFTLIEVKTVARIRFHFYWRALKQLDLERYDSIIINDTGAALVASLYFPKALQERSLVYLHGSEPENIFVNSSLLFKILGFKQKYCRLLCNCAHIIAVSHFMKKKFIRLTGLDELYDRIHVVYVGVDDTLFYPEPVDLHGSLSLDQSRKLLLSVGRLVEKKGYARLLRIFKRLVEDGGDYHWIVIGNGDYYREFTRLIEERKLQDYITIITTLDRQALRRYYSSVDLFLLLSDFEESLGLVYLEAQFCGTPVIGRNAAGVIETIVPGKTGYLVDTDDECYERVKSGRYTTIVPGDFNEVIERFAIKNTIKRLIELL